MSSVITTTDDSFEADVLRAARPVLVDFGADWCPPCQAIAPHLEELARTSGDRIFVVKVDVDASPQIAARFGIRGLPTLIVFQDGEPAGKRVGALPRGELHHWIESVTR